MEQINRQNPNFKPYDVDSCSEYEQEPWPPLENFKDQKEFEKYCHENPRKIVKVNDGLTRAQRREHRQFALEFEELLDCLRANHMVYCDDPFEEFAMPFHPPDKHKLHKQHILQRARQKREQEKLMAKLEEKARKLREEGTPPPTESSDDSTDDELVDCKFTN